MKSTMNRKSADYRREILIDSHIYPVILSDDQETLLAVKAAGGVSVGLVGKGQENKLWGVDYVIEADSADEVEDWYLERIVRRHLGLPWTIATTKRLIIREFTVEDAGNVLKETEEETAGDQVFYTPELLAAYIRSQYRFCEYGIWAVVRKEDGVLVGTAGVSPAGSSGEIPEGKDEESLELGYHIFRPYRRNGYATEACQAVIQYVKEELKCSLTAAVKPDNTGSVRLLEKLGISYYFADSGARI